MGGKGKRHRKQQKNKARLDCQAVSTVPCNETRLSLGLQNQLLLSLNSELKSDL